MMTRFEKRAATVGRPDGLGGVADRASATLLAVGGSVLAPRVRPLVSGWVDAVRRRPRARPRTHYRALAGAPHASTTGAFTPDASPSGASSADDRPSPAAGVAEVERRTGDLAPQRAERDDFVLSLDAARADIAPTVAALRRIADAVGAAMRRPLLVAVAHDALHRYATEVERAALAPEDPWAPRDAHLAIPARPPVFDLADRTRTYADAAAGDLGTLADRLAEAAEQLERLPMRAASLRIDRGYAEGVAEPARPDDVLDAASLTRTTIADLPRGVQAAVRDADRLLRVTTKWHGEVLALGMADAVQTELGDVATCSDEVLGCLQRLSALAARCSSAGELLDAAS